MRNLPFGLALTLGAFVLSAFTQSSSSHARGTAYSMGGFETDHLLSVGGGISSPSMTSALGENPAGLIYNQSFKLLTQVASGNEQLNPLGYGAGIFAGNGSVGGGMVLQGFNNQTGTTSGNVLLLNWGLAAEFPSINMAWGFTGTRTISATGDVRGTGSGTTWCVDTGVIFNPRGSNRIGATIYQLLDDVDAVGLGYALDPSPWATFAVDASYTTKARTTVVKPSLSFHLSKFQMSSGYGLRVQGTEWSWIRQGLSLAVGFEVTPHFSIQAYYNHLAQYLAAVTISL
jgi:hypothetical protein